MPISWRTISAFALLLTLGCSDVRAGDDLPANRTYGLWQSCPIGGGGYLQDVIFAPSDPKRVYLLSDVGGLNRSDDGGQTWHMLHGNLPAAASSYSPRSLLVHPTNANRLVLATGDKWSGTGGIWISDDGGNSWRKTRDARFEGDGHQRHAASVLAADPRNPNHLLAAPIGGGILISQDGGATWSATAEPNVGSCHIMMNPSNPNQVWLCAQSWTSRAANKPKSGLPGGFFRSDDGGRTWRQLSEQSPTEIVSMQANPSHLLGIFGKEQIKISRDAGETWEPYSKGLAPYPGKWDSHKDGVFAALATGPDFILAGGSGGNIYRLDRNSQEWSAVRPTTIDEGNWWGRLRPNAHKHFGSALAFLAVSPHDPHEWWFTDWYAAYRSPDSGQSWQLRIDGIEMTVVHTVGQDPNNPNLVHVGVADVGYFRSSDQGRTFDRIETNIGNNIKCISASTQKKGRVYATGPKTYEWMANQIFISDDSGQTWRRAPMTGLPDMNSHRCNTIVASPTEPDSVWLTVSGAIKQGDGGLYRSADGGQSWQWVSGLPEASRFFRSEIFLGNAELALSNDGSIAASSMGTKRLLVRPKGQAVFKEVKLPSGSSPNALTADISKAGRFYLALEYGGLWRTDNGGLNWRRIVDRGTWHVAVDSQNPRRIAAITAEGAIFSEDEGETWCELDAGLPYRHIRNVAGFAGDYLFVGTGGNGVFRFPIAKVQKSAKSMATPATIAAQ